MRTMKDRKERKMRKHKGGSFILLARLGFRFKSCFQAKNKKDFREKKLMETAMIKEKSERIRKEVD